MQLIGMLDSPYVRRVAIALRLLDLPFEHRPISVFRHLAQFQAINPVVKAPTLVTAEGTVLMDSGLILQWIEAQAGRSLAPRAGAALAQDLRLQGLALAACEKTVQIVYEHELRPADKRHAPWLERVEQQLQAAYQALDAAIAAQAPRAEAAALGHGSIAAAVAWTFTQFVRPGQCPASVYPALADFAARAEALPTFQAFPLD